MKKYISVMLAALMLIMFCGCEEEKIEVKEYPKSQFASAEIQNKAFGEFTFQYPSAWSIEIDVNLNDIAEAGTVFRVFAPPGASNKMASFTVLMSKNSKISTMDIKKEYVQTLMEDTESATGTEYEIIEFEYYNINGQTYAYYTAKTQVDGVDVDVTQAMTVIDDTLYVFSTNVFADENRDDTYAILSSLIYGKTEDTQTE